MAKAKKGETVICVPCGAEYVVSEVGTAITEAWCCGTPMQRRPAEAARRAGAGRKPAARTAPAKKPAARTAAAKKK